MSTLQIFKWHRSLISSQHLPEVRASVIKVWVKAFDLAWASLVLPSSVRLPVVSVSTNQSSNCVELLPLKLGISWISEFVKVVCFWAEHMVSMCCYSTSSRGSVGADGWSAIDNLWSSCSMWLRASVGLPSPAWTLWCKSSRFWVRIARLVWIPALHSQSYPCPHDGNHLEYQYLVHAE